jgi:5-methylcytosine-specific restriction protein A
MRLKKIPVDTKAMKGVDKQCASPGCSGLTQSPYRYCASCRARKAPPRPVQEAPRPSPYERGYGGDWPDKSRRYLAAHPWCVWPGATEPTPHADRANDGTRPGCCEMAAEETDHIKPFGGRNMALRDNPDNWQGLCKRHHGMKTRKGRNEIEHD